MFVSYKLFFLIFVQFSTSFKMTEDDILFDEAYELQEVIWRYFFLKNPFFHM